MLNLFFRLTLTFIIFFSPFAFATVHLWSITILQCSILLFFFLYMLQSVKNGSIQYRRNALNSFFLLFILYIAFQLCFGITKYSYQTFSGLKTALLYFALFLAVTNGIQTRKEIDSVIFKVVLAGFFVSLLGIFQKLLGTDKIYWIRDVEHANFFGPFINENHFACYISIIALVTLGSISANIYSWVKLPENLSLKQKFLIIVDTVLNKKVFFTIFSFVIMVTALVLSKSRGGILFFVIGVACFILFLLSGKNAKKTIWIILSVLFAICVLLNWIGIDKTLEEFRTVLNLPHLSGRIAVYEEAKNMLADYPLFGVGIGAFSAIFPMYRTGFELSFYRHLHNDIFQLLVESGIAGFVIIILPFAIFLLRLFAGTGKTKSMYKYYTSLGILAAFFYLGLHSLVGFGMRINAISTLFVILLSIALLIIHLPPARENERVKMSIKRVVIIKSGKARRVLYAVSTLILVCLSFGISKPFIAYILIKNADNASSFKKAIKLDPKNDHLYYKYYQFILKQYRKKGLIKKEIVYNRAEGAIDKARELNPYNTSYIIAKGWLEFRRKDYSSANLLFKEAAIMEPQNCRVQLVYAYALFWQGVNEKNEEKKNVLLKKGLIYYEKARFLSGHVHHLISVIKNKKAYQILKERLKKEGITIY